MGGEGEELVKVGFQGVRGGVEGGLLGGGRRYMRKNGMRMGMDGSRGRRCPVQGGLEGPTWVMFGAGEPVLGSLEGGVSE